MHIRVVLYCSLGKKILEFKQLKQYKNPQCLFSFFSEYLYEIC